MNSCVRRSTLVAVLTLHPECSSKQFFAFSGRHKLHRCPMLSGCHARQPALDKNTPNSQRHTKDTLLCKNQKKILPQFCRCLLAMPTKKWGKANKATLSRLIEDGDVDIYNTSTTNINRVGAAHFPHREKKLPSQLSRLCCFFRRGEGIQWREEEKRRR
jgi:hypothetical protein